MPEETRPKRPAAPAWAKALLVLVILLALVFLQPDALGQANPAFLLMQRLFFLPLLLSALFFGLKGGLACAFIVSANSLYVFSDQPQAYADSALILGSEVVLYFLTGGVIGLLQDRARKAALQLKAAESLALLGQAAAAVAHELKTPLVAIGGFAQRIFRDLEPDHPHREKLRIIVDQVAHMEHLLREMLDYSRPVELHLFPQSINDLVQEAMAMCSVTAEGLKVSLLAKLAPEQNLPILDGGRVKQVIINLVENAVQASACGTRVSVLTRLDHDEVLVEVKDNGCGISPENRPKVFLPFFTTKSQGTGLGLAISQKIVEAHGGHLEMQSAPGAGTTFTARFPLCGPCQPGYPHRSLVRNISK